MLFKKVFLLNSKKHFCINYYIDACSLEIPDRNLFTATELAFLKPVQYPRTYSGFMDANKWVNDFFPNRGPLPDGHPVQKDPWLKRMAERALNGKTGNILDDHFMKVYRNRSLRKYSHNGDSSFDLNFRSEKNIAKHHPDGYQKKTLEKYLMLTRQFEQASGIDLTSSP